MEDSGCVYLDLTSNNYCYFCGEKFDFESAEFEGTAEVVLVETGRHEQCHAECAILLCGNPDEAVMA